MELGTEARGENGQEAKACLRCRSLRYWHTRARTNHRADEKGAALMFVLVSLCRRAARCGIRDRGCPKSGAADVSRKIGSWALHVKPIDAAHNGANGEGRPTGCWDLPLLKLPGPAARGWRPAAWAAWYI